MPRPSPAPECAAELEAAAPHPELFQSGRRATRDPRCREPRRPAIRGSSRRATVDPATRSVRLTPVGASLCVSRFPRHPRTPRGGDVGGDRTILRNSQRQHDRLVRGRWLHAQAVSFSGGPTAMWTVRVGDVGSGWRISSATGLTSPFAVSWWPNIPVCQPTLLMKEDAFSSLQPETAQGSVSVAQARRPRSPHAPA